MNENGTNQELSQAVGQELAGFVASLLVLLDEKLDKRLAGTFERTLQAIGNYGTIGMACC